MTDTNNDTTGGGTSSGFGSGPGRRGRFFDDLAGMAGGAFSVMAGARAEVEAAVKAQVEILVQRLDLVRREDLDAALEVARRAREEASALALRVAALEGKAAAGDPDPTAQSAKASSVEPEAVSPAPKEDPTDPVSLA